MDDPQRSKRSASWIGDCGYGPGAWWHTIELKEVERQLICKMPDAAGLVANRTGTTLELEVIPTVPAPELFTPGEPCDIVAKEDGVTFPLPRWKALPRCRPANGKKGVMCSFPAISSARKGKTAPYRPVARLSLRSTSRAANCFYDHGGACCPGRSVYHPRFAAGRWQVPLERAPNEGDAMLLETKVTQLCGLYLPARVITQRWQPVMRPRAFAGADRRQIPPNAKAQLAEGSRCKTSFCKQPQ